MTYEEFLEEVKSVQLPRWRLLEKRIRSDDKTNRSPIQVLAGFFSRQPPITPAECASALRLELGPDLALVIMKAEDNEWLKENLVKKIRMDLLSATGLSEQ